MEKSQVFGLKCGELLASYDPELSSWKMSQLSLFEDLKPSLEGLPNWGMMRNGELLQLETLERPTLEKDGFVLPTPMKTDPDRKAKYKQGGTPLLRAIIDNLPTPLKHDASVHPGQPSRWERVTSLNVSIAKMEGYNKKTIGKTKRLHPDFVNWMMGYPPGWLS